jgi:hypothetical protein
MLLSGLDFPFLGGELATDDELPLIWNALRGELLPTFISDHPGTRPWAWWRFESKEPRRQVNDGPASEGPANYFGCPSVFLGMPPSDMFESEADYLRRHNLLTPDEKRLLG